MGDNIITVEITSVLWRVFSTVEGNLQYCGGITAVHVGGSFSTVRGYLQYCGGCSVQWGITSVQWGDNISTVGNSFSTVEGIQYIGGITSVHVGITLVQWGITSVLWRVFSTVGGRILISACSGH